MSGPDPSPRASVFRFGVFELDLEEGILYRQGRRVELPPQPFQLLALLVSQSGRILSREAIRRALWNGEVHVDYDQGINSCIRRIRTALGDSAEAPRFVETVPKRGYRFLASVEGVSAERTGGGATATISQKPDGFGGLSPDLASGVWVTLLCTVVLLGFVGVLLYRDVVASSSGERVMLAVLPFEDLGGPTVEPGTESEGYFSAGLTEELISRLGSLAPEALGVIARTSIVGYQGTTKAVTRIGEELGVAYLVEGSVRRDGERLRITAQLIRVADQSHLWAQSYDYTYDDIFTIQGQVARQVQEALVKELLSSHPRASRLADPLLPRPPTGHPEAYDAYLRGRYHFGLYTREGFERAAVALERAVALDPGFAQAAAALAEARIFLAWQAPEPEPRVAAAKEAAAQALALDPDSAQAHTVLGIAAFYFEWDFEAAGEAFRRAVTLDPGDAEAHHWYAGYLSALGFHGAAQDEEALARRLDPRSLTVRSDRCWYFLFDGNRQAAIAECRATLELEPHHRWALRGLIEAQIRLRPPADIRPALAQLLAAYEEDEAQITAVRGGTAEGALEHYHRWNLVREQGRAAQGLPTSGSDLAIVRAAVGDLEGAFAALERALVERDPWLVFLKVDPRFRPLRGDPRFEAALQQVGLAQAPSTIRR